jgi:hypothetical protein
MSKFSHIIYLSILSLIVALVLVVLVFRGLSYYGTGMEERFYHPDNTLLKPSGELGHGMGIIGSILMITGVIIYMVRKRYRIFARMGILKHWLEFHIFLCTLGPALVLFHTAFKFGGLVAISFWSMVAVFLSGIIGRFIYIQIPRSVEGRELNFSEIGELKSDVASFARDTYNLDEESYNIITDSIKKKVGLYYRNPITGYFRKRSDDRKTLRSVGKLLKQKNMPKPDSRVILAMVKDDIILNRKMENLDSMRNLFKYWHVVHSPFALLMLIIMVIHVAVTIALGYRWIF